MPKTNQQVVYIKGLGKRYDDDAGVLDALKGVDLQINSGDFLAIMGPSGSGKSTLMNILGLLDRPTSGVFLLDDVDTATLSDKNLAMLRRDRVGFIFQNFNLLPRLNVAQNVELPMIYQKIRTRERSKRVIEALNKVGLGDKAKNKSNRLSGGQVQRVAIARALVNKPSLILADEPTGNLDTKTGEEILKLLVKLNQQGVTIVIVTHNPEVSQFASRTVLVRDGQVAEKRKSL
ncbi:ABC transporter ATP-binding protein [Candidatus Saccharibacteria bacterium]|nr:ABC transporter ATP-binding protein [Candidatus Saccharibacteria bacterium]